MDGLGVKRAVDFVQIIVGNQLVLDLRCRLYLLQMKDPQSFLILDLVMDGGTFLL
jgi:hypothetical protein